MIKFASRMDNMSASEIRELLKSASDPAIIKFSGGSPAPELVPGRGNEAGFNEGI